MELPYGWETKFFKDSFKNISPGDKKIKRRNYLDSGALPIIDQGEEYIGGYTNDETKTQEINLPVIIFGDHTRRFKFISQKFAVGADGTKILKPKEFLLPKFAYYQCLQLSIPNKGYSRHFQYLKKNMIKYPTKLEEQQQIVNEIETQLTRLDASVRALKSVKKKLDVYRKSVLKSAFDGEILPFESNRKPLKELVSIGKERANPKFHPNKPYLGMAHIESLSGKVLETHYAKEMKATSAVFSSGDVLYGRLRPYLNKVVCPDFSGLCSTEFIILKPNKSVLSKFLAWRLRTSEFVNFANSLNSGDRPRVKFSQISEFEINLPVIEVQQQIVSEIESRFSVIDKLEQTIDNSLLKAEQLRKSILKSAFEGRLVK
ncbi:restriction endonuclease subunit S [Candidatus Woesearchaeota archaeon]|nr:restriction endonuclease subunit S [Candidatus Woesearchaeota archaeon]